jgi:hypothetical protein
MSRDKNSCNVHLNWDETKLVKSIFEALVAKDESLLEIKNFKRVLLRSQNACRNQKEYPAKMKALADKRKKYMVQA